MQNLGERLKSARNKHRITQEQLAEMAEVTRTMIARYEAGRQLPSLDTLIRIADALDVSIDFLLGRADDSGIYHEKGIVTPPSSRDKKRGAGGLPRDREELERMIQEMIQAALQKNENASSRL